MSRIRSIHPGLWTDEAFVQLSPMARLFLMGLWNECDDMGSFAWSPLGLKMRILPADNADGVALLGEIEDAGILLKYEVAGKPYGAVRNFCQYQRPKKPNSVHPQTDEVRKWVNTEARSTRDGGEPVGNQSPPEPEKPRQMEDGGGRMKVGSDEPTPPAPKRGSGKHLLPEDWKLPAVSELPPRARALAEQWTRASYETEGEAFILFWRAERRMKSDWVGTWANRIVDRHAKVMRDQKFGNAPVDKPAAVSATPAELEDRAKFYERIGKPDDAAECRRRAMSIGAVANDIAKQMRAS